jgi:hypothetical protein
VIDVRWQIVSGAVPGSDAAGPIAAGNGARLGVGDVAGRRLNKTSETFIDPR